MIQINLVPDIKQEFIRAKRVRNLVVSGAIIVGIASVAIVVLLALYLFGVQALRSGVADGDIKSKFGQLQQVKDLGNMLTIQSQLSNISSLHDSKNISSRLFGLLAAVNPVAPNQVVVSSAQFDGDNKKIHMDLQAQNGYIAAEVFKKTIEGTTVVYQDDKSNKQTAPIAQDVSLSDMSYGEDASGAKVLRFSLTFTYSDSLFARTSTNVSIVRPDRQDATDSFRRLPESLFGTRAADVGGGK